MFRKYLLIILFIFCYTFAFSFQINTSNYKNLIGRKIKFSETLPKKQRYKVANKTLRTKKYAGKIALISNIELDKKSNIVLFLSISLKGKEKTIKIKTKTKNVTFENITLLALPKPASTSPQNPIKRNPAPVQKTSAPNNHSSYYVPDNGNNTSTHFFIGILFIGAPILFIYFLIKTNRKNRELIEETTKTGRGEPSEEELILILRQAGFPPGILFHDLYIPTRNHTFSQIDLVMITNVGLIVFEIKDYSGWIFGNGKQQSWTQVLNYGKEKHRFYNPIMQNNKHIYRLKKYLQEEIPCFSIVVFFGDCELKDISFIPHNTFIVKSYKVLEVIQHILSTQKEITISENIPRLLNQAFDYGNDQNIRTKHIENINDMLGKDRIFR